MKIFKLLAILIIISGIFIFSTCKKQNTPASTKQTTNLFETIPPSESGLDFTNSIIENDDINYLHYGYIYNGAGVAAGDINNDGLTDLYFSSNLDYNKLYLNQGNFKFKDITSSAGVDGGLGYKSGVTMVDINQDGWLDIFVCKTAVKDSSYRQKILYLNNGNGTFTDKAKEFGLDDMSYTTQAYFFDSDNDGDLDVYFVNHPMNFEDNNYIKPIISKSSTAGKDYKYISDRLYENRNGHFIDITSKAKLLNEAFGLSAVIGDFNHDQLPDIYVANDFLQPDYLYINQGKNVFEDKFSQYFMHCPFSSMGTDFADINNDGCLDLINVDMTPKENFRQKNLIMTQNYDRYQLMLHSGLKAQFSINSLQLGSCGGGFSDIAFLTQTAYTDWSWTPLIADLDNDGNKDIFITNGYLHDVMHSDYNRYKLDSLEKLYNSGLITKLQWINHMPSVKVKDFLFKNSGNLTFTDVSDDWNSGPASFSHGACYADLDNDGDLDLIISNVNDPVTLLKNKSREISQNNFIRFALKPAEKKSSLGTKIIVTTSDNQQQIQVFQPTKGFLSKVEDIIHFGIGANPSITKVEIIWPDQKMLVLNNPEINKIHTINPIDAKEIYSESSTTKIFTTIKNNTEALSHQENEFIDFKREPLIVNKLSEEGPGIAVADINQDGLDDIFIGQSSGTTSRILIQTKEGNFTQSNSSVFELDKNSEDVDALFFNANDDQLPDLYVVSGSNEKANNSPEYQDRLYINEGNGKFKKSSSIPKETLSGACVTSADIDNDGDIDLFVGSRCTPGRYPESPEHLLLINNKGVFVNEIQAFGENLKNIGMITDAQFSDLNKDGKPELIIVGEYTSPLIFNMEAGKFVNSTATFGLSDYKGWWRCLQIADLNGDSYPDLIVGNQGLNSHFHASLNQPIELYYKDFDMNGTIDPILCQYNGNNSYPVLYRDRLLDQMVFLKKKFTRYEPFSKASITDIFSKEQLSDAKILKVTDLNSKVFINQEGKNFKPVTLPIESQISVTKDILAEDFNRDGKTDLLFVGNFYGTDAQFGRLDSGLGCLLLGQGDGTFNYLTQKLSGLNIQGDTRKIFKVKTNKNFKLLITKNSNSFEWIEWKQ